MNRIETILQYTEGDTVLDFGAVQHDADNANNPDWLHDHLCRTHERVVGVDILQKEVKRLQEQGYNMRYGNVETVRYTQQFDTVVAGELIEHLSNPGRMLDRAHDNLKDGGALVLSTPNPWALVHLRRLALGNLQINDEHTGWYGPITMAQLLDRRGFELEAYTATGPKHNGVMQIARWLGFDRFGGNTWVFKARKV